MTDYTISSKLSNETVYAYYRGRFWRWDGSIWKESHLMTQKFERARAADKKLTPQEFLTNGAEFAPLDEYEIDSAMLDALENAKPCKNAPIDPVEEFPTSSAQCSGAATAAESQTAASPAVPAASTPMTETAVAAPNSAALNSAGESAPAPSNISPSFDYSGLPAQTVDTLHMAENQYAQGKKMTETGLRWMVNAVSMAHDALCSTVVQQLDNGQFAPKEDTFRAWCASISLSKSSAYNLLRVAERFGSIEIDGKSILDVQPATLLYEAAKPSAPAELVQKVTTGQITSSAEYRAVLKENQQLRTDRVNALNQAEREKQRADAAVSEIGERDKTIKSLIDRSEEADARADNMESKYKAALADVQGLTEKNSHLQQSYEYANEAYKTADVQRQQAEAERDKAEARAKNAEDALKKQPIVGVTDPEEVDRLAHQQAYGIAADMTDEIKKEKDALQKQLKDKDRQLNVMRRQVNDLAQTDFEIANNFQVQIWSAWNSCKSSYSRLVGEDLESTFLTICQAMDGVKEEAARLCRQPVGYDGGADDEPDV